MCTRVYISTTARNNVQLNKREREKVTTIPRTSCRGCEGSHNATVSLLNSFPSPLSMFFLWPTSLTIIAFWSCALYVSVLPICNYSVYRIAGNFRGRKLSRIGGNSIFAEKLLRIARFCSAKGRHAPNFAEKTFAYSHKTVKFAKVFSLESFPLYGTVFIYRSETIVTCMVCQMLHTNYWFIMLFSEKDIEIQPGLEPGFLNSNQMISSSELWNWSSG